MTCVLCISERGLSPQLKVNAALFPILPCCIKTIYAGFFIILNIESSILNTFNATEHLTQNFIDPNASIAFEMQAGEKLQFGHEKKIFGQTKNFMNCFHIF